MKAKAPPSRPVKLIDIAEPNVQFSGLIKCGDINYDDEEDPAEPSEHLCYIWPHKLGLPLRLINLPIVISDLTGREQVLLVVNATGCTCELVPLLPIGNLQKRLNKHDFDLTIAAVDGWLISTATGGPRPELHVSVVLKRNWEKSGRPMVLDVPLPPGSSLH